MTTVLVIDDDPSARRYIRQMAPREWTFLEAGNIHEGLEQVRRHLEKLDLVILDIDLKGVVDGCVVCAEIRRLSRSLSILPFTCQTDRLTALEVMGCLRPIQKPIRPTTLEKRLRTVLCEVVASPHVSPLVEVIHDQWTEIERLQRNSPHTQQVAVYAASPVKRGGLTRMLASSAEPVEIVSVGALRAAMDSARWTAIVVDADDAASVRALAREYRVPLILVAEAAASLRGLDWPEVGAVLREADPQLPARLAEALDALAAGRAVPWEASPEELSGEFLVPPAMARRLAHPKLPTRLVELLWLANQGFRDRQIADRMGVSEASIGSYWRRAGQALKLTSRDAVRAWARQRLANEGGGAEEAVGA